MNTILDAESELERHLRGQLSALQAGREQRRFDKQHELTAARQALERLRTSLEMQHPRHSLEPHYSSAAVRTLHQRWFDLTEQYTALRRDRLQGGQGLAPAQATARIVALEATMQTLRGEIRTALLLYEAEVRREGARLSLAQTEKDAPLLAEAEERVRQLEIEVASI